MTTEPIHSIRDLRRLRPQEHWSWTIALYLYLAGMGAGSYVIGTVMNWLVNPSRALTIWGQPIDPAKAAILWGPILVAIGAPFLILDLGIKRRFLYACLNPRTSWVARGFVILSAFIIFGFALFLKSAFPFEWLHAESGLWRIPELVAFALAFATALYTGILLKATKSIPLWNSYFLPVLFLVSALSTGSMAIILSMLGSGLFSYGTWIMRVLMYAVQIIVLIEAIVLYLYLSGRYSSSEQGKDSVRHLLFGEKTFIFWWGDVLLGLVLPFILVSIVSFFQGDTWLIFIAGVFLLLGGFSLRLSVLRAGIREQIPMQRWIEFQYDLRGTK
jgi:polysulfide reductase chain C